MREAWTDDRLDDLNRKVDNGFQRVDARFDAMQEHLDRRFEAIDKRFDGLQHTLIVTNTTFIVGLLGILATQL